VFGSFWQSAMIEQCDGVSIYLIGQATVPLLSRLIIRFSRDHPASANLIEFDRYFAV
jgi:hypothetical protein